MSKTRLLIISVDQPLLAKESYTFPPSITVFVSFNLSSALFNTISSTVLLATRRITFTGLDEKMSWITVSFLPKNFARNGIFRFERQEGCTKQIRNSKQSFQKQSLVQIKFFSENFLFQSRFPSAQSWKTNCKQDPARRRGQTLSVLYDEPSRPPASHSVGWNRCLQISLCPLTWGLIPDHLQSANRSVRHSLVSKRKDAWKKTHV